MKRYFILFAVLGIFLLTFHSCSKSSPDPTPPPTDVCAGKTIAITATAAPISGCGTAGSITASASGSTGFTYKLGTAGSYQASGNFTGVAPGNYTVFAKDAAGCEKTQAVAVTSNSALGPKFTAVKSLVAARCQSCHNSTNSQGGMNFSVDCNIVQFQARIKARAVDAGDMPQGGPMLTAGEKAIITDWIAAGGLLSN